MIDASSTMTAALVHAVTGPLRYLPTLVLPVVVAAALIALIVYLLRRTSKKSGQ